MLFYFYSNLILVYEKTLKKYEIVILFNLIKHTVCLFVCFKLRETVYALQYVFILLPILSLYTVMIV